MIVGVLTAETMAEQALRMTMFCGFLCFRSCYSQLFFDFGAYAHKTLQMQALYVDAPPDKVKD